MWLLPYDGAKVKGRRPADEEVYRGRSIRCRVNDRGPFIKGRVIDVSVSAARALGMMDAGVVMVVLGVD